jgi:hypothetical protein
MIDSLPAQVGVQNPFRLIGRKVSARVNKPVNISRKFKVSQLILARRKERALKAPRRTRLKKREGDNKPQAKGRATSQREIFFLIRMP